jgi:CO/xanthine dehydrogenase FAD-binding subunit
MTAVDKRPVLVREAESLVGRQVTADALESLADAAYSQAHPVNNVSELPPAYRREMVKVFVRRAIDDAMSAADAYGGRYEEGY